jgi:hypothetical protein
MSEFKREDYSYTSIDGDEWDITLVQTSDRKYVEIRKGDETQVQWDTEMLLDIADVARQAFQRQAPISSGPNNLRKPQISDHRNQEVSEEPKNETPSDMIQTSVDQSMENMDDAARAVESFSASKMAEDIAKRQGGASPAPETSKIKRN